MQLDDRLACDLELVEMSAITDFLRAADKRSVEKCGISRPEIGSSCIAIASNIDVLAMNRVVGLGLNEEVEETVVDTIIDTYKKAGVPRFFIQLHPLAKSSNLAQLLESKGLYHYNNWIKLYRKAESLPAARTDLRIEEIGPNHASAFAEIVTSCFGWPENMRDWMADLVGRRNWRFYMAFDDDRPAATAAAFLHGRYAWLDFAATLPEFRGRGAQSALAERRVRDIIGSGCEWLVVETAEETPEHAAPSYRNMIRLGFEAAYVRPNFIFRAK